MIAFFEIATKIEEPAYLPSSITKKYNECDQMSIYCSYENVKFLRSLRLLLLNLIQPMKTSNKYATTLLIIFLTSPLFAQVIKPCRNDSGLFGYCDKDGKTVIEHKYYDALDFIDGHAAVLNGDKWGIINESGNWMVEPIYDEVYNCENVPDQILVKVEDKWSLINAYGIQMTHEYEVRSPWYEFELEGPNAAFHKDTWFSVIRKGKWGIVDLQDHVKIPFDYQYTRVIRKVVDGKRMVVSVVLKQKDKYAWQRVDAGAATGFEYDQFLGEYAEFLFFRKGTESVILNSISGEKVRDAGRSYFNLIDDEDSAGLVNSVGRIIVPFKYHIVDISKVQMHAVFGFRDALGLSDLIGNVLLPPEYVEIREIVSSPATIAVKNQEGKVAIMAIEGKTARPITEFKYDYAVPDNGKIRIKMGNKLGFVSFEGVETWN